VRGVASVFSLFYKRKVSRIAKPASQQSLRVLFHTGAADLLAGEPVVVVLAAELVLGGADEAGCDDAPEAAASLATSAVGLLGLAAISWKISCVRVQHHHRKRKSEERKKIGAREKGGKKNVQRWRRVAASPS